MASVIRRPFAPLDEVRLQSLTSAKNRQNAVTSFNAHSKRKASDAISFDDSENIDPSVSKRSKGSDGSLSAKSGPKHYILTASEPRPAVCQAISKPASASFTRTVLKPKAPSTKVQANAARRSLPAFPNKDVLGRSAGRGGLLQSRRRTTLSTRRDAVTKVASAVPFSIDAALKGTLSAFASASPISLPVPSSSLSLGESDLDSSWFFNIHEDTPEQEMTNLLQHSTCVLDISSDEESEKKARNARAEGRDKENIPPPNDASQTSLSRLEAADSMLVEKARNPLGQLNAADFYEEGCDESSIVLVADDVDEDGAEAEAPPEASLDTVVAEAVARDIKAPAKTTDVTVEELMSRSEPPTMAAVLQPIEGTGESFEVWESGSSKDSEELVQA